MIEVEPAMEPDARTGMSPLTVDEIVIVPSSSDGMYPATELDPAMFDARAFWPSTASVPVTSDDPVEEAARWWIC